MKHLKSFKDINHFLKEDIEEISSLFIDFADNWDIDFVGQVEYIPYGTNIISLSISSDALDSKGNNKFNSFIKYNDYENNIDKFSHYEHLNVNIRMRPDDYDQLQIVKGKMTEIKNDLIKIGNRLNSLGYFGYCWMPDGESTPNYRFHISTKESNPFLPMPTEKLRRMGYAYICTF